MSEDHKCSMVHFNTRKGPHVWMCLDCGRHTDNEFFTKEEFESLRLFALSMRDRFKLEPPRCKHGVRAVDRCFECECDPNIGYI